MIGVTRPTAAVTKSDIGWNQCGLSNGLYCTARDRCKPRASSVIFFRLLNCARSTSWNWRYTNGFYYVLSCEKYLVRRAARGYAPQTRSELVKSWRMHMTQTMHVMRILIKYNRLRMVEATQSETIRWKTQINFLQFKNGRLSRFIYAESIYQFTTYL